MRLLVAQHSTVDAVCPSEDISDRDALETLDLVQSGLELDEGLVNPWVIGEEGAEVKSLSALERVRPPVAQQAVSLLRMGVCLLGLV